jgi:uncharacterized membrane protein YdbT with pleckstrin-like domain
MSYVDDNLLPGESVMYRARLHRIVYAAPVVWIAVALSLLIAQAWLPGGIVAFGGLLLLLIRWIDVITSEFAVTSERIVIKVGFIRRRSLELLLGQVEAIAVDQSILGRILGYGTIVIVGTGGTREPFRTMSSPLDFRRQVQLQSQI